MKKWTGPRCALLLGTCKIEIAMRAPSEDMINEQSTLSQAQVQAFYHDNFVDSQVSDFLKLHRSLELLLPGKIIDVGGGCGFFAKALESLTDFKVRVIDMDRQSIDNCTNLGIEAAYGDALNPQFIGDEKIVCFNLILHHLIGKTESDTCVMQKRAISVWGGRCDAIFVNEYIYESFIFTDISGWMIYQVTSSKFLSHLGRLFARVFPSLNANTFGVGVRFRSHSEWRRIFESLGFEIVNTVRGKQEGISLPRRLLLIKNCRRDSFLLVRRDASRKDKH
jgi:hypothetical protein